MNRLSLRMIVSLVVLVMGTLGVALALYTGEQFRDAAVENQRQAYEEILGLRVGDKLKSLEKLAGEMGQAVQNEAEFRAALAASDKQKLATYLENQFHQYFVTAGILDLYSLTAFDSNLNVIGAAYNSNGDVAINKMAGAVCNDLIQQAKIRNGASRYKRISMMCKTDHRPSLHVLVPIGGLRILGYLDVVTNPIHFMASIGNDLGLLLAVKLDDGSVLYSSANWPKETRDSSHLLASFHQHMPNSSETAFVVTVLRDIEFYRSKLIQKRNKVLLTALLLTVALVVLSLIVLNRTTLHPLTALAREINSLSFEEGFENRKLNVVGNKEVQTLTQNFNQLSQKLQLAYSELHEANADLRANSENLEEIVEQRTADLAIARDAAISANKSKSLFLANMSHELRTPLNAIIGYSEMLLEDAKEQGDLEKIGDLGKINSAGQHLLALIKDILDLSKIEAGRMELELTDFNLPKLINEITDTASPLFIKNQNKLSVIFDTKVDNMTGDSTKLRQAVLNLLGNAAKFTENGEVQLTVTDVNYNHQEFVEINVTDTGIGLTEDQKDKIFDSFSQADLSTTRKYGGTGLGLTISRRYCQMMGGTLTVTSQLNVGSTFSIRVPVHFAAQDAANYQNRMANSHELVQHHANYPSVCIASSDIRAYEVARKLEQIGFLVFVESDLKLLQARFQLSMLHLLLLDSDWLIGDNKFRELIKNSGILERVAVATLGSLSEKSNLETTIFRPQIAARVIALNYNDSSNNLREKLLPIINRYAQDPILLIGKPGKNMQPLFHALQSHGWKIQKHHSLLDARKGFLKQKASAIVMEMDFFTPECAAWMDSLKFKTPTGSIPVILCAGCGERGTLQSVVNRVDKVLQGDLQIDEMATEIDNLLSHRVA